MWTVRSLSTSATAASRASAAASTLPSARPSAVSRKPLALSLGIALYAVALVLWWLTLRDGAAPLGRLQLLVSREDSVDAPSAPASAPAATPAAASSAPSTVRTLPVDPSTIVVPRYKCLGWRQTGGCSPDGPREPEHDLKCGTLLSGGLSGYCALEDLATGQEVVSLRANCSTVRGDVKFKCSQVADMAHMRYELDKVVAQAKWDEFHRQQAQGQLRVAEAPPTNGIVMVVYPKLLVSVHASVRLLRSLGCELPIELWYLENELGREPETRPIVQSLLSEFGPITLRGVTDGRVLGFAAKVYAIANSDFDQVLFLDADNTPVRDPTFLFTDSKAFRTTGAVFWPDFWHPRSTIFNIHEHSPLWEMVGTPFVDMFEQESGQILIDRRRAKASGALAALEYLAYHEPNHFANYKFLHGDKDLFRLAWMKSETPFHMVAHPAAATGFMKNPKFGGGSFCGMTMAQFDPDARADAGPDAVLFLHRNAKKLTGTEDEEKDRLWTHIQTFAFPDGVADDAEAYRILSEHYKIGIRGLPSKMARTSMCYGGQDKKHFKLTPMTELAWNVTGLETSLLQFAKEAAKIGTPSP